MTVTPAEPHPNHFAVTQVSVTTAILLSGSVEADETAPYELGPERPTA